MNADGTIKGRMPCSPTAVIASGVGFSMPGRPIPPGPKSSPAVRVPLGVAGFFPVTTSLTTEFSTPVKAALRCRTASAAPRRRWAGCTMLPMLGAVLRRRRPRQPSLGWKAGDRHRSGPGGTDEPRRDHGGQGVGQLRRQHVGQRPGHRQRRPLRRDGHHPRASAGRSVAGLKITATDKAGSTLIETIAGAFRLPR